MCIGIPMRIESTVSTRAVVAGDPQTPASGRLIDTSLLEQAPAVGDWLLVHVNVAIRSMSAGEAKQVGDALQAVTAAAAGLPFEHLLGDLIDREPELPAHLRAAQAAVNDNEQ